MSQKYNSNGKGKKRKIVTPVRSLEGWKGLGKKVLILECSRQNLSSKGCLEEVAIRLYNYYKYGSGTEGNEDSEVSRIWKNNINLAVNSNHSDDIDVSHNGSNFGEIGDVDWGSQLKSNMSTSINLTDLMSTIRSIIGEEICKRKGDKDMQINLGNQLEQVDSSGVHIKMEMKQTFNSEEILQVKDKGLTVINGRIKTDIGSQHNVKHLPHERWNFFNSGISHKMQKVYLLGWKIYVTFCEKTQLTLLPLVERNIVFFVTTLAKRLTYKTIKVYLCAIQFYSNIFGFKENINNMRILIYVLQGICKLQG